MEKKLTKKEEMRIVEYLKVLSDSAESPRQEKELSKEFLDALEEKENDERYWLHTIAKSLRNTAEQLVSQGATSCYESKNQRSCRPYEYEEWSQDSSTVNSFRPTLAGWGSGRNL